MRSLPLYQGAPLAAVEAEPGLPADPTCSRCEAVTGARTVCFPPQSFRAKHGGVLVVGEQPTASEDANRRALSAGLGQMALGQIESRAAADGTPVTVTYALRCGGGKLVLRSPSTSERSRLVKAIASCRPYLAHTVRRVTPERIIAIGPWAAQALFDRTVFANAERRAFAWLYGDDEGAGVPTPVFFLMHPHYANRGGKFYKQWLREDIEWAMTETPPHPPWDGKLFVIETRAEAEAACAELRRAPWVAFDTETVGTQFNADFDLVAISAAVPGSDHGYVWPRSRIKDAEVCEPILDLLADPAVKKLGQNVKYDALTMRLSRGVEVQNLVGDIRLWRKLLDAEADAALDTMSELVGCGGHKGEFQEAKKRVRTLIERTQRAAAKGRPAPEDCPPELEAAIRLGHDPKMQIMNLLPEPVVNRYAARDAVVTARLGVHLGRQAKARPETWRIWTDVVRDASRALEQVEWWGVAASRPSIQAFSTYLTGKIALLEGVFAQAGVNPDSPPQMAKYLFETLKLRPPARGKKGANGKQSTDKATLKAMRDQHPIIDQLLLYRKFTKLSGTYAEGLGVFVAADGRIHPNFKIDGARSGRLSCTDPNVQNIPRPNTLEGVMARDCFTAPPGYTLLELDYSQLELRVAAIVAGDAKMAEVFRSGADYHTRTAELISKYAWGIPAEAVTDTHRTGAKAFNFGLVYGKTDKTLSRDLGLTEEDAGRIRKAILGEFVDLAKWLKQQIRCAEREGGVWTMWNGERARWRPAPEICSPDDYQRFHAENIAVNSPIQGLASDFCLASISRIVRYLLEEGLPAKLVLTVHDSVLLEVRDDLVEEVAHETNHLMSNYDTGDVPLVVDFKRGRSWGQLEKYKPGQVAAAA